MFSKRLHYFSIQELWVNNQVLNVKYLISKFLKSHLSVVDRSREFSLFFFFFLF